MIGLAVLLGIMFLANELIFVDLEQPETFDPFRLDRWKHGDLD